MKKPIEIMTNRELYEEYEQKRKDERHFLIQQEMTKRINRKMYTADVPAIFSQYKLNGAGDQMH